MDIRFWQCLRGPSLVSICFPCTCVSMLRRPHWTTWKCAEAGSSRQTFHFCRVYGPSTPSPAARYPTFARACGSGLAHQVLFDARCVIGELQSSLAHCSPAVMRDDITASCNALLLPGQQQEKRIPASATQHTKSRFPYAVPSSHLP
jgi:hypothetical protein